VFPFYIFYEGDSRDNIAKNVGNDLDRFLKSQKDSSFFLSADMKFIMAVMSGPSEPLGPTTKEGWDMYHKCDVNSKKEVDKKSGFRTDLNIAMDRTYQGALVSPESLLGIVPCLMHGLSRVGEKLLNLEIKHIMSEGHKAEQRGEKREVYVDSKISVLEDNINVRGVRHGNFSIIVEKGVPQPVGLNNDHARAILSQVPGDSEQEYPHVLSGVVGTQKIKLNAIPTTVREKLDLPCDFTEFDLVSRIWYHFYSMHLIAVEDKKSANSNSDPYSEDEILKYKFHAETFYQLFVHRYGFKELTPYMMCYIDHIPQLMRRLPFSVGRFVAEGGENTNYFHQKFFYHHTTRHGGRQQIDPIKSIFHNMWFRLKYDMASYETSVKPGDNEAAQAFNCFIKERVQTHAAEIIQRAYRQFKGKRYTCPCDDNVLSEATSVGIFHGKTFVMSGTVPKLSCLAGKKNTQDALAEVIQQHGGAVRSSLDKKAKSAKKFTVVCNKKTSTKVISTSRDLAIAVREGYPCLSYEFIDACLEAGDNLAEGRFRIDTSDIKVRSRKLTLERKHFLHCKRMISVLKKKQFVKQKKQPNQNKKCFPLNHAQYYIQQRRKQLRKASNAAECREQTRQLSTEWNGLSTPVKEGYRQKYMEVKAVLS
jgi:hypothetical protein